MRILSVRLNNVRRFTQPVEIAGFTAGLNVLSAPNEQGKSTLFDALHALFFLDAKSWKRNEAAALAPHAGGDPEVSAEIALAGETYRLSKTFTKRAGKGEVTVHRDGQLFKQADAAEAWISTLIRAPKDGGPSGLLWVRQGLTSFATGKEDDTLSARRTLLASVAGEIEEVTGGRRMEALRTAVAEDLGQYLTATGKARAQGPLGLAEAELEQLGHTRAELAEKVRSLQGHLDDRRRLRRERAQLDDREATAARTQALQAARTDLTRAEDHAARRQALSDALTLAEARLTNADREHEQLCERIVELDQAQKDAAELTQAEAPAQAHTQARAEAFQNARHDEQAAEEALRRVRTERDHLLEAKAARGAMAERALMQEKLTRARQLEQQADEARKILAQTPDSAAISRLEAAHQALKLLTHTRADQAAAITLTEVAPDTPPDALPRLDDAPLPLDTRLPLPDGARIVLPGGGALILHPAASDGADQLARAQQAFDQALHEVGAPDYSLALQAGARHRDATELLHRTRAECSALAPKGVNALAAALAALPQPPAQQDVALPNPEQLEQDFQRAQSALDHARVALEASRADHDAAQDALRTLTARQMATQSRLERAQAALPDAGAARARQAQHQADRPPLEGARNKLQNELEALDATAPDLEQVRLRADRAEASTLRVQERLRQIDIDLSGLEKTIEYQADLDVEARLSQTEQQLEAAQARTEAIRTEVAVLTRLSEALEQARSEARDAYTGPIQAELAPLLRMVLPGADLLLDADAVLPSGLKRDSGEDGFDQLSGGTQEQIALLVRLAFARLLAKAGTPAPVILDDALVYTDDARIERMFDALTRQAGDVQIIVLTCRQRAFQGLGGKALSFQPVADA